MELVLRVFLGRIIVRSVVFEFSPFRKVRFQFINGHKYQQALGDRKLCCVVYQN